MRCKIISLLLCISLFCTLLCGCSESVPGTDTPADNGNDTGLTSGGTENTVTSPVANADLFTSRDKDVGYDEDTAAIIVLDGTEIMTDSAAVQVSGTTATITKEGTYILRGTLSDGQIAVDIDKAEKVQLVLDNVSINSASSAAIYVKNADKVFITMANDSVNTLTNSGEFAAIDENSIDAVIFAKDDIVLNGNGTLTVKTEYGHGISAKDDLKITSGEYVIEAEKHGVEANGGTVVLKDSGGNTLASFTPTKAFNNVVVSTPEIEVGKTYTVAAGSGEVKVNMSALIYGQTQGMGGMGPGGGRPKMW